MQNVNTSWLVGGGIAAAALALGSWQYFPKTTPPPPVETASETATSSPKSETPVQAQVSAPRLRAFPINTADSILSWNFKGAYAGNDAKIAEAAADSARLKSLLGTGAFDDYDLYLGIGNDASLVGDGKTAYDNFNRAIALYPDNQGLAYANMANLMDELGAYYTAADAYAKATSVDPGDLQHHIARLKYLTRQFPKDNARIVAAFADASRQFGDSAPILSIEAEWLSAQGRYADAIKAWEAVKTLSPGKDTTAIDIEIARLKAKQ